MPLPAAHARIIFDALHSVKSNHMRRREFCPCLFHFPCFFRKLFSCFFPSRWAERFVLPKRRGLFVRIRAIFLLHSCWNPGACLWPAETTQRVTASDNYLPEERKQVGKLCLAKNTRRLLDLYGFHSIHNVAHSNHGTCPLGKGLLARSSVDPSLPIE